MGFADQPIVMPPLAAHFGASLAVAAPLVGPLVVKALLLRPLARVLCRLVVADDAARARAEKRVVTEKVTRHAADCRALQAACSVCRRAGHSGHHRETNNSGD